MKSLPTALDDRLEDTCMVIPSRRSTLHTRVGKRCPSQGRDGEELHDGAKILNTASEQVVQQIQVDWTRREQGNYPFVNERTE